MNELPQESLAEFRNHPSEIGMVRQVLHPVDDLGNETHPDFRYSALGIPAADGLEIAQRRLGETNPDGHPLPDAEP